MIPALRRALGLVLLLVPAVAYASPGRTLDLNDVLRLHQAGVSEDIIISEVIVTESVFDLSVDDILRLKEAGLSDRLVQFLVDTGRGKESTEDSAVSPDENGTTWAEDDSASDWANEIEQLPSTTSYYVSLNYSYPGWWYDCYWYDYWNWDFQYYPYQCSWVGSLGAWYPAWYGYRTCWTPAYWGYRSWYYDRWGYPRYAGIRHCSGGDRFYAWDRDSGYYHRHELSQTKTKAGGGSARYPLYADAGLKMPDGGRLQIRDADVPSRPPTKTRDGRLALDDHPFRPGAKEPVRGPTDTVKAPESGGRKPIASGRTVLGDQPVRQPIREPVRDVRAPADGGRPVKVRTLSDPSGEVAEPPARGHDVETPPPPSTPAPKANAPAPPPEDRGSTPPTRTVKPAPTPQPKSPPAVTPAPSRPTPAPSRPPRASSPKPAPQRPEAQRPQSKTSPRPKGGGRR